MTGSLAAESFKAALRHLLQARGHGAQAGLANALGVHRSAINDILNGRKGSSAKMQEKIAAHFGLTLAEMLRIGENLIQGRVVFPWADALDGLTKDQQLRRIVELTNEQVGHPQDNLTFIRYLCLFLEDRKTASDIYTAYLKLVRSRVK